ncbi:mRNA-decapping enzyme 1A-like [Toxorhynchites rutilus septentrionalis]|uniref:mRNA-decapping enzyme 1A-like n=1 Tax=Toxorhynchites rutilus septentrionalis TaxID=329112 RepID=UPI0024798ED4|nr:mRNA-decapping enzyme 1A-like [Toxorhynchites rutilus septentrionalis]
MAEQSELRMNLVAIQRTDPYAKDIVNSSPHVAFYTFNTAENEWEKTDVEGALFIYSRTAEPYHSIFINNRLNRNSLVEPINSLIELQSQPPFLLYRNERSRIRGIWFYKDQECDRIREIISSLVADCDNENIRPIEMGKVQANGNARGNNVDIFTMLTKAQENFNNSGGMPQSAQSQEQVPNSRNLPAVINVVPDQSTPQSVVNFFNAAAKQPAASEVPLFQTLMSNPVHTLEQIEKQHRATTPQKEALPSGKLTPEVSELENSFKFMGIPINTGPVPVQESGTSPLATFLSSTNLAAVRNNNQQILKAKPIEISELESRQQQQQQQQQQQHPHPQPLHELLKKSDSMNNHVSRLNPTPTTGSASKPALMPPTMFTPSGSTTAAKGLSDLFANVASKKQQEQANGNSPSVTDLLTKSNHNHQPAPPGFYPMAGSVEPLTQAQLIQAVSYLIKHDPDFIRKLHEAYLKSFQEMMAL